MSKKARIGGRVQISGKAYEVLTTPEPDGQWYRIIVTPHWQASSESFVARSETWRRGCGPWKIFDPAMSSEKLGGES